jgi:hypothetical protein
LAVRILRCFGVHLGFLDHEGAAGVDRAWPAEVFDVVECLRW